MRDDAMLPLLTLAGTLTWQLPQLTSLNTLPPRPRSRPTLRPRRRARFRRLIKQHNLNAIRTAYYPKDAHFYLAYSLRPLNAAGRD